MNFKIYWFFFFKFWKVDFFFREENREKVLPSAGSLFTDDHKGQSWADPKLGTRNLIRENIYLRGRVSQQMSTPVSADSLITCLEWLGCADTGGREPGTWAQGVCCQEASREPDLRMEPTRYGCGNLSILSARLTAWSEEILPFSSVSLAFFMFFFRVVGCV